MPLKTYAYILASAKTFLFYFGLKRNVLGLFTVA